MFEYLEEMIVRSWWVVLFVLCCYFGYEQGLAKKDSAFALLQIQYKELQRKKIVAQQHQESLSREIDSQNDPAWIELLLMREMGLVPEGKIKVYFN
ncbi:MAG: hypothetical protein WCF65_05820 [Parachlamydiaceae bacterium]